MELGRCEPTQDFLPMAGSPESRVDSTGDPILSALFQTIMEQFNPSLRNFIAMGKNYEKALAGRERQPWSVGHHP